MSNWAAFVSLFMVWLVSPCSSMTPQGIETLQAATASKISLGPIIATAGAAATASPALITNGLVNYWRFDSTFVDQVTSAGLFNPLHVSLAADRFGRANSSAFFNSGYMQMPSNVYFTGDHSISMWAKIASTTGSQWQALYLIQNDMFVDFFGLFVAPAGYLMVELGQSAAKMNYLSPSIQPNAYVNQWVHIGVTLGSSVLSFYFNGNLANSVALTYPTISNVIRASSFFGSPSYLLNAYIDDVLFYNRMLSEAEMATVATYNSVNVAASNTPPQSAFAALQSSLAHYWTFNENYVNVVNGASGSPVGNVSFGEDHFGMANRALSISGGYVLLPTDVYLSGDYSIAFWLRVNQFTPFFQTLIRLKRPDYTNSFYLYMAPTGLLQLVMTNTLYQQYINTAYTLPLKQWVHIGLTMSGPLLSVYVNGALRERYAFSVSMASAVHATSMFGDGGLAAQPLYVSLDDMMFFSRALTASEVLTVMSYSMSSVVGQSLVTASAPTTTKSPKSQQCPEGFVGANCNIECGLTYYQSNVKIYNGQSAVAHSWPSIAHILIDFGGSGSVCSGTLIDLTTVLTAG